MKKIFKFTVLFTFLVLILSILVGCAQKETEEVKSMDFSTVDTSEYIILGEYKGMSMTLKDSSQKKGECVWQRVVENSTVISYPEGQLEYYIAQSKKKHAAYAEKSDVTYEEMLNLLGISEYSIKREAEMLVKEDLVLYAIIKAEKIELTEKEKSTLFDKYAEKFVTSYGYTEEYVKENMSDEIYGAMLHDKTIEFLIVNNSFEAQN